MKINSLLVAIAISTIAISAEAQETGTFKDPRDGKVYKTVRIASQIWMAENLTFKTASGSWAYDNRSENVAKFGYLYDWETAKKSCPSGWHLPKDSEWQTLVENLGGAFNAGKKMKSASGWADAGNGTNESGFAGLPGGGRSDDGTCFSIDSTGYWYSATEEVPGAVWYRYLYYPIDLVNSDNAGTPRDGMSVRCVKD
jgi:uncharacterized protein (TIGR02145 family)